MSAIPSLAIFATAFLVTMPAVARALRIDPAEILRSEEPRALQPAEACSRSAPCMLLASYHFRRHSYQFVSLTLARDLRGSPPPGWHFLRGIRGSTFPKPPLSSKISSLLKADGALATYTPLLGFKTCGRAPERGHEFLEMRVLLETFQIVDHQAVGIFIPALDGFAKILKGVIGAVGNCCHTREVEPDPGAISLLRRTVLLFDHVAKQPAGFVVAMLVGQRFPELPQSKQVVAIERAHGSNSGFESLAGKLFGFRVVALLDQCSGDIPLGPQGSGIFWSEDTNPGRKDFPLQFFRFVETPLFEESIGQLGLSGQSVGMVHTECFRLNRQHLAVKLLSIGIAAFGKKEARKVVQIADGLWVFGPQHALRGGHIFAIHLLSFRVAALRLKGQCQIVRRGQSFRMIRPRDAALDID